MTDTAARSINSDSGYLRLDHVRTYADLVATARADRDLSPADAAEVATMLRAAADLAVSHGHAPDGYTVARFRLHDFLHRVAALRAPLPSFVAIGRAVEIVDNI